MKEDVLNKEGSSTTVDIPKPPRLASLDALRGLDIFMLLAFDEIASVFRNGPAPIFTQQTEFWQAFWKPLGALVDVPAWAEKSRAVSEALLNQAQHTGWNQGFSLLDLVMPLFVFMAGAAIPFALARYLTPGHKKTAALWIRIIRRVAVLWFFGMLVQGHFLDLVPSGFKLYSNTLQTIASGYFFACLAYLYLPSWGQWSLFAATLLGFWGINAYVTLDGCGGGSYEPTTNIAYAVDRIVLGRFREYAVVNADGVVEFNPGYVYTWVFSTITFTATALSGMFAGDFLRSIREKLSKFAENDATNRRRIQMKAFATLLIAGVLCIIVGRTWGAIPEGKFGYCPIIKYIWTPTMTLYSSGLSLVLLAVFYLIYDVWQSRILRTFFLVFGTNAIAAYMISHLLHYGEFAGWLLYGLEQYIGIWQNTLNYVVGACLIWLFLWSFWKRGKFLRV